MAERTATNILKVGICVKMQWFNRSIYRFIVRSNLCVILLFKYLWYYFIRNFINNFKIQSYILLVNCVMQTVKIILSLKGLIELWDCELPKRLSNRPRRLNCNGQIKNTIYCTCAQTQEILENCPRCAISVQKVDYPYTLYAWPT